MVMQSVGDLEQTVRERSPDDELEIRHQPSIAAKTGLLRCIPKARLASAESWQRGGACV